MRKILLAALALWACLTLLLASACSKTAAGDPGEALLAHMKAIFKILKDNSGNCDKAVTEVTAYTEVNRAELEELKARLEELDRTQSPEEKAKQDQKIKKMAEEMMTIAMADMMDFGSKCPEHMAKINAAMAALEMKK